MFASQLRQAVEASPRSALTHVSSLLWRAYAAGSITESEAQSLAELIEAKKALPAAEKPLQRRVGSRPRSHASMERRRSWVASGHLPPALACRFTVGEQAALAVIAVEVRKHGRCTLTNDHIAALAGVGRTTVKRAVREAAALGFIRVQERRLTAFRNDSNIVVVIDPAWSAWLRLRRAGMHCDLCIVGSNSRPARLQVRKQGAANAAKGLSRPASAALPQFSRWRVAPLTCFNI